MITILSEYRKPDAPPTFTAFESPVASWPNSTATDGDEEKQQLLKVAEATLSSELEDELERISDEETVLQQKINDVKTKIGTSDANG